MRTYDDTFSGTKIYPGKVSPRSLIWCYSGFRCHHSRLSRLFLGHKLIYGNGILGKALCARRQQDLPISEWQDRVFVSTAQKPSQNSMDDALSKNAQEGYL